MGDNTSIGWTRGDDGEAGATWNPFRAYLKSSGAELVEAIEGEEQSGWFCEKVGPECANCYAWAMNLWRGNGQDYSPEALALLDLRCDPKTLLKPLQWQRGRKIFPCSMTDWMLRHYPDEWVAALLGVAAIADQHTFQFLTKRSSRQRHLLQELAALGPGAALNLCLGELFKLAPEAKRYAERAAKRGNKTLTGPPQFPPPNAWLGVSIGSHEYMSRAADLERTPAALRWWSVEPFLGEYPTTMWTQVNEIMGRHGVDWVVIGGESGAREKARDFLIPVARNLLADAASHKIPAFMKQTGVRPIDFRSARESWPDWTNRCNGDAGDAEWVAVKVTGKGDDPAEWPEILRVQQFPEARC